MDVVQQNSDMSLNETIALPFGHTTKSHKYCIVCKVTKNLIVVPDRAKLELFIQRGIIIQGKPRCCKRHLNGNIFKQQDLYRITDSEKSTIMNNFEIFKFLNDTRRLAQRRSLDFDEPGALNDEDHRRLPGISINNFNHLFNQINNKIRDTKNRSARTCLTLLLIKL